MEAKPSNEFKSEMHTWLAPSGAEGGKGPNRIIFLKPQTYMNDSGQALKVILNFYKINVGQDLLVVHDETDLPFGSLRLSKDSSSAGHNGVQSIINNLGTKDFHRLRIGVESRATRNDIPTDAFVLQNFSPDELQKLQVDIFPKVKMEIEKFISN